ncbi:MAG: hypothetical protein E6R03_05215 [Hyphomicrobiaceae bacterium]|nr:MAG: hypothetical protein E6R03_05215 [Hyphomicrobiaceae bacterium]
MSKRKHGYIVIQQGGSSSELYLHAFDTLSEVRQYRKSCDNAAYETSEPVEVPLRLLDDKEFVDIAEAIVDACRELL